MLQVMTGPFGEIAYHDTRMRPCALYPALNMPSRSFARAEGLQAANLTSTPGILSFDRSARARAAIDLFGEPAKRKH